MIHTRKQLGETPLQMLERLRAERPELAGETLSYAGRLDPMAEGEMLVLVGEENKRRDAFMHFDKEYVATFLIGVTTDTGDVLGLITRRSGETVSKSTIGAVVAGLHGLTKQVYPWFSGKTFKGIKLFELFKRGETDIERPVRTIEVKEAELGVVMETPAADIAQYITETVGKVKGDFRQEAILAGWREYFREHHAPLQVFTVRFRVSTGTFIRGFCDVMPFPVALLALERTKIFTDK